jgi:hypothetical protein
MIGSLLHNDELSTIQVVPGTVGSGLVETFVGEIPPQRTGPELRLIGGKLAVGVQLVR